MTRAAPAARAAPARRPARGARARARSRAAPLAGRHGSVRRRRQQPARPRTTTQPKRDPAPAAPADPAAPASRIARSSPCSRSPAIGVRLVRPAGARPHRTSSSLGLGQRVAHRRRSPPSAATSSTATARCSRSRCRRRRSSPTPGDQGPDRVRGQARADRAGRPGRARGAARRTTRARSPTWPARSTTDDRQAGARARPRRHLVPGRVAALLPERLGRRARWWASSAPTTTVSAAWSTTTTSCSPASPGSVQVERDPQGNDIPGGERQVTPAKRGRGPRAHDRLVAAVEHRAGAARRASTAMNAKGGTAIDRRRADRRHPRDGDGRRRRPTTRPAQPGARDRERTGRVTDVYEPGSTNKVITMAGAIEDGLVDARHRRSTTCGSRSTSATRDYEDVEEHPTTMTVADILPQSSNVGTIQIAHELGKDRLDALPATRSGSARRPGSDFPASRRARRSTPPSTPTRAWARSRSATASRSPPMQMLDVYTTIANDGMAPSAAPRRRDHRRRRRAPRRAAAASRAQVVVARDHGRAVTGMLQRRGGRRHRREGRRSRATRWPARPGPPARRPTTPGEYIASFAGFAPADDPRLAAIVVIDAPQGSIFGGRRRRAGVLSRSCGTPSPTSGCRRREPRRRPVAVTARRRVTPGTLTSDSRDRAERTPTRASARPARRSRRIGGVDRASSPGIRTSRSSSITHDSRRVAPGCLLRLHPGRDHRRPRPRARRRRRAARSRCSSSGSCPLAVAAGPGRQRPARRSVRWPHASTGDPSRRCGCSASPAPTARPPPPTCSRRSRCRAGDRVGVDRHRRRAHRGASRSPSGAPRPRPPSCRRCWPACATRASARGDGGVVARARHSTASTACSSPPCASPTSSHDHLDFHGTLDAYFEAKARLFTPTRSRRGGRTSTTRAATELASRARDAGLDVSTYALDDTRADLLAVDVELGGDAHARHADRGRAPVAGSTSALPLVGRFNVANALAAAATARAARSPVEAVVGGPGRPARRTRPVRADRRRPAVHRARRLRPHARRPGPGARRGPAARRTRADASRACSAAAATATRRSAR